MTGYHTAFDEQDNLIGEGARHFRHEQLAALREWMLCLHPKPEPAATQEVAQPAQGGHSESSNQARAGAKHLDAKSPLCISGLL